jgi:metal-responsive CopG/Arc/MetJ family transcriptional regulator
MKAKGGRGQRSDNKFKRISLTIEPNLKFKLDAEMEALKISRSALIVKAIEQYLEISSRRSNHVDSTINNTSNTLLENSNNTDNTTLTEPSQTSHTALVTTSSPENNTQKLIQALEQGYKLEQSSRGSSYLVKGSERFYVRPRELQMLKKLGHLG